MRFVGQGAKVRCPFCIESDWVRPSLLRWYDLLPWVVGIKPYRCMQCFRRFRIFDGTEIA
jgi:hypothetical protein